MSLEFGFIEKKTAQIDDLIQKKEEIIKLLKEKRAAIINQAVTKGLDPNAKMKPSGIDWIGDIPEGWQKKRGLRIVVWVILYLLEHTGKDFQSIVFPLLAKEIFVTLQKR